MPLEPINYMINQPNQGNNFMEGLQIGQALKQIGAQRAAEEQAAQAKEQYAADLKTAFDNPTPKSFAMLSTKYPTQREAFKQSFEMLEAPKKAAELQTTGQVYTALLNNKPEIANGIINEQILALENSGKDASKLKKIKETIEQDPQTATGIAGFMLSNMMGQKEFKDYQDALGLAGKETREKGLFPAKLEEAVGKGKEATATATIKEAEAVEAPAQQKAKTKEQIAKATTEEWNAKYAPAIKESGLRLNQAQISNIGSQIADRSARLKLDTNKINLDIAEKLQKLSNKASTLSPSSLKIVNDASIKSSIAGQSVDQLNGLATKMDKLPSWSGYAGGAAEFFKRSLGYQDAITGVKKEYIRLKNDAVIRALPPGPATDRDIQLFAAGFPDENSNPKELASFLRGMAKMQRISSKVEEAKADWVTETGGSLGKTRTGFTAGGYQVKPNQSFGEFSQAVAKAVTIKEAKKEQTSPKNLNVPAPFIPTKQSQKLFDSADAIIYGGEIMAKAQEYASWITKNANLKGTEQFNTVVKAYETARQIETSNIEARSQYKREIAADEISEARPKPEPTLTEQAVGLGETGLALATGATIGAAGHIVGTLRGLADQILTGNFGTQQAAQAVAQSAEQGAQQFTYAPRTATGQAMTQTAGEVLAPLAALMPATAELGMAGQAARLATPMAKIAIPQATRVAGEVLAPVTQPIKQAVAPIVQKVSTKLKPEQTAKMTPEQILISEERAAKAESLPVPIELTKGQKTREFSEQQFERETAKQPELGAPIRERFAEQRAATSKNFDSFLASTGAETQSHLEAGGVVGGTLQKMFENSKNKVNTLYKEAEKTAGDTPTTLTSFINHLNESAPEAEMANILKVAKQKAISLGAAIEDEAGNLIPQPITLKNVSILRSAINDSTDYSPVNIRQSALMKGTIDEGTEGVGGTLYKKAREARIEKAKDFENVSLIKNILGLKKGTADRAIATENIFNKAILGSSLEDATRLKTLLQKGGGEGVQAWNELKGATVRYIKDEATKGISRDEAGNAIISPAQLDRVVKALDKNKKLDLVLGEKGAEQVRILNDVAKDAFTSPPNSVNYSNTAATILAAMDMAVSGTIGMPAPIMSSLRLLLNNIKEKGIKARVAENLKKLDTSKKGK